MTSRANEEEISFLRTDDFICLSCLSHGLSERLCLGAEGFGNRMCSLESIAKEVPPANMPPCIFILEQALSARALQEMLSSRNELSDSHTSGHRTLLYGHAIRLKHRNSSMYLACLGTSSTEDKLAFDVGLEREANTEACWWTIHPASKQRSVGEKVRIGDDLILVSVSSERYLHVYGDSVSSSGVIASFQQTLWTVIPVSSGVVRQKSLHMAFGGDVIRLFHGDECLTIQAAGDTEEGQIISNEATSSFDYHQSVMYQLGSVSGHASSLWQIEHTKIKWCAGFFSWEDAVRLRHVTTGRYLGITHTGSGGNPSAPGQIDVVLLSPSESDDAATVFYIKQTKDDKKKVEIDREHEGMGEPDVCLGETLIYLQHAALGWWLSYESYETKKRGVGKVEEKKAVLLAEGHMDDVFSLVRAQEEESLSAAAIRRSTAVFSAFNRSLDALASSDGLGGVGVAAAAGGGGAAGAPSSPTVGAEGVPLNLDEVNQCLEDLIEFFAQPETHEEHEARQSKLAALANRQDLFQEEGMISLVLETIDKFTGTFRSRREFALAVGEERGNRFSDLGNYLYLLLAALIRGNRENCAQFAAPARLDWLFNRLELQQSFAEGVLDALHCVLTDSDEALNVITAQHIHTLIGLLDKQGRDPRVLEVLCSICIGRQGGAVRLNQDLIYESLLPERDLLLQTRLVAQSGSMRPNIFVGIKPGGSMYTKWYFEVFIDALENVTHQPPGIRIGWGNTDGYTPHPVGGPGWGGISLGDDFYSFAFDGQNLWTGGKAKQALFSSGAGGEGLNRRTSIAPSAISTTASNGSANLKRGDVIGCLLDLTGPVIQFNLNGNLVKGYFQDFNTTGLFFPCVSMTARASARFVLGGTHGKLKHGPPAGYAPIIDALQPSQRLRLEPVFSFGRLDKSIFSGPLASPLPSQDVFVPVPISTDKIHLPNVVERIRDKLAENLHELWSMRKIEQGWVFGERRDESRRRHPCLCAFDKLQQQERQYNVTMALENLKTIFALRYNIGYESLPEGTRMKTIKLGASYTQSNGYKPQPLDLSAIRLSSRLETLVDELAENTHNIWAKDRIHQGWTYGSTEDNTQKRSPHLVPYSEVNSTIKKMNRESATDAVKTLLAYGYVIEPVSGESEQTRENPLDVLEEATMNYRAASSKAVTRGKWYYEVELLTYGMVRVGWATKNASAATTIGMSGSSYSFAPEQARKYHRDGRPYGKRCEPGDVIGCMLNLNERSITFSLNGEIMMDPLGQEIAFKDIKVNYGFVPAFTLGSGQQVRINFGNVVQTLKYFTICGLQEGYSPFAVNMSHPVPMWYSKVDASLFRELKSNHSRLETKVSGAYPPVINILAKSPSPTGLHQMEYLRLSLGIRCKPQFTSRSMADRRAHLDHLRKQLEPEDYHHHGMGMGGPANIDLMTQEIGAAGLEVRDRRGKRARLANVFRKTRPRDVSPDVTSGFSGGVSLVSGSASASGIVGSKKGDPATASQTSAGAHEGSPGPAGEEFELLLPEQSALDNAIADFMDEFAYTVLIPPGQNPCLVNVGWVGSCFKISKPASISGGNPFPVDPDFNVTQLATAPTPTTKSTAEGDTTSVASESSASEKTSASDSGTEMEKLLNFAEVRQVAVCLLHDDLTLKSAVAERSSFLVNVGDLIQKISTPEDIGKRVSQGLAVTCWVDTASGTLGFRLNDRDTLIRFQVEPSTHLFAAVFVRPTARDCVQFELGRRSRYHLPLTAGMLRPPRRANMPMPHRLNVQAIERVHWAPVPGEQSKIQSMKMSDQRGWSMLLENSAPRLAIKLPEANRCFSILELEEMPDLLKFHAKTLALYRALCCHGNHNVAQKLTSHVDQYQFLYVIQSKYVHGSLRSEFVNLLLAMHLDSPMKLKQVTGREFIVPLEKDDLEVTKSPAHILKIVYDWDPDHIPAVKEHRSIRPKLITDPYLLMLKRRRSERIKLSAASPGADGTGAGNFAIPSGGGEAQPETVLNAAMAAAGPSGLLKLLDCPSFPLDLLKRQTLDALIDMANTGGHVRDPFGGNFEHALLPLLLILNHLLVMGSLDAADLATVLGLLSPKLFPNTPSWRVTPITGSLLKLPLPESVKMEVCHLFHHLCDLQLRHRIESIVNFANTAVSEIQNDQMQRYLAIKVANLPSAVAAPRTREFRCPPNVQIRNLLHMPGPGGPSGLLEDSSSASAENEAISPLDLADSSDDLTSDGYSKNPCAEEIKDLMRLFHHRLMNHLGVVKPEVEDTWDYEGTIKLLQEAAAAGLQQRTPASSTGASTTPNTNSSSFTAPTLADTTQPTTDASPAPSNSEQPQSELTELLNIPTLLLPEGVGDPESGASGPPSAVRVIWKLVSGSSDTGDDSIDGGTRTSRQLALGGPEELKPRGRKLHQLILETVSDWASSSIIENVELIRQMFYLLYRQYGALDELRQGLTRTYAIGNRSKEDVSRLLRSLGRIRCLLGVQVGANEEILLKNCLWDIMNNNVFFQHPDLIRVLAVHETVMQLMVHTLSKASLDSPSAAATATAAATSTASELQHQQQHQGSQSPHSTTEDALSLRRRQGSGAGAGLPALMEEVEEATLSGSNLGRNVSVGPTEMVVQCCRFLCYFCRTSWQNQKAMFDHLSYMLENSSMLLARPSLRGICPLDVAYSSLMDNNELALALREKQLEKVAVYLSRCGVQSNAELLTKGYPDIGWDPVEGERFLDFLRFTVWVNGESVEENANLVVRLLIRRPECLGPALRGGTKSVPSRRQRLNSQSAGQSGIVGGGGGSEGMDQLAPPGSPEVSGGGAGSGAGGVNSAGSTAGGIGDDAHSTTASNANTASSSAGGGLLKGIKEGIVMSAQIKLVKMAMDAEAQGLNPEDEDMGWRTVLMDYEDCNLFAPLPYNFSNLPPEEDEDYVDLGAAILTFYSVLVDLLGRCAPELDASKSESVRGRAILQSLVSMQDLEGVLSLRFILPPPKLDMQINAEGLEQWVDKSPMPPGLLPEHKAAVVLFMERVYGLTDSDTFVRLLENAFLPDMRAVTLLDSAQRGVTASDMTLALNRYICGSVLPLLTRYAHFLAVYEVTAGLLESTLHTAYRLATCRSITNNQRDVVSDFLVALVEHIQPFSMTSLIRKIAKNMRTVGRESVVSLRVLTTFYQRFGSYYSSEGWTAEYSSGVGESGGGGGVGGGGSSVGASKPGGTQRVTVAGSSTMRDLSDTSFVRATAAGMTATATEEEKNLTAELFSLIFNNLSCRRYDAELYVYALPCLTAIGCALPPDYCSSHWDAQSKIGDDTMGLDVPVHPGGPESGVDLRGSNQQHETFVPTPLVTSSIKLPAALSILVDQFAKHCHDTWAQELVDQGYVYGLTLDEARRTHPNIRSYHSLSQRDQMRYIQPVTETLRAMLALGWTIDPSGVCHEDDGTGLGLRRRQFIHSQTESPQGYIPAPKDLHGVNVTRELIDLAERLADNAHQIWAKQKMEELEEIGGGVHQLLVPYDILTDRERKRYRRLTHELIRYLQYWGYRLSCKPINQKLDTTKTGTTATTTATASSAIKQFPGERGEGHPSSRFAYGLLSKLLDYVEGAMSTVREDKPSHMFSRHQNLTQTSEDMKLLVKVVLPLLERYFYTRKSYFIDPYSGASIEEKKMATMLFTKLFTLLRLKTRCFGADVNVTVSCLKCLIECLDIKAIVKISYAEDFVRVRLMPFFSFCADDLNLIIRNLNSGRYSHIKGTIRRGACSIDYLHMILLPTLKTMFEHISKTGVGEDLILGHLQVTCYRILNALYVLGTTGRKHANRPELMEELNRHRPVLGECLAALTTCFPVAFLEPELSAHNPRSIAYNTEEADYSFEARDLLQKIGKTLPSLHNIIDDIVHLAEAGSSGTQEPHLIEVTLPMLCSYLPVWWRKNLAQRQYARRRPGSKAASFFPDNEEFLTALDAEGEGLLELGSGGGGDSGDGGGDTNDDDDDEEKGWGAATGPITTVTADLMNRVLGSVLQLIQNNIDNSNAPWMTRIATRTQPIVGNATVDMLGKYFLPVSQRLLDQAFAVQSWERRLGNETDKEGDLTAACELLVRNMFALYPLLITFVDRYRTEWLKQPTVETDRLFSAVANLFLIWNGSPNFKREEETFVGIHELDTLALIMPTAERGTISTDVAPRALSHYHTKSGKGPKKGFTSLMVASIKRLLPIGLCVLGGRQQELVQRAKRMFLKHEVEIDIVEYLRYALDKEDDPETKTHRWQKLLYRKIDRMIALTGCHDALGVPTKEEVINRIMTLAKVMHALYLVSHVAPTILNRGAWKKLVSTQRKRAVMACFRMQPFYALPRHRAINHFLMAYHDGWLSHEQSLGVQLIEEITGASLEEKIQSGANAPVPTPIAGMAHSSHSGDAGSGLADAASPNSSSGGGGSGDNESMSIIARAIIETSMYSDSSDEDNISLLGGSGSDGGGGGNGGAPIASSSTPATNEQGEDSTAPTEGGGHSVFATDYCATPDPLRQLLTALCRTAMDQAPDDPLYLAFARIMAKSCSGKDEDDESGGSSGGGGGEEGSAEAGEEEGLTSQEQEEQKQRLLFEQNRLSDRGAAEMVLLELAASKGEATPVATASVELGIAILLEGNVSVQNRMLAYLAEKRLTGFFTSLAGLMQNCSVLDLDTFERCRKAEGLAVGLSDMEGITNLYDADFTCKIFRLLQLMCEGHNSAFQDYLRTQSSNTTSVNLIISTVDYLLRLQESIMDFYWHFSNKPVIDESGRTNFIKAIKIGKQLFRTLTEYIQGPCQGNQHALANSRLWDAISGFFYLFAHMQDKLSKDPEQLDLLHEFLNLQTEMMIMLLSMLEGNVVNGSIGRQMVDTLAESSANVELTLTFFDIFLRMKEITNSDAFLAFDVNKDGWISHREFRTALEQQKSLNEEEITYIMGCVDANLDGKIDFQEFTERFYNPARDIGFNVALLLTNLSEHIPGDIRLERLLQKAKGMLEMFDPLLGRIEITNKEGRIERVYFEVRQENIDQWEKPQIKESKRTFLHSVVGESGDKEKLECFVNFAEDTIFEMQHAQGISGDDENLQISRVVAVRNLLEATRLSSAFAFLGTLISFLSPHQLWKCWCGLRQMSFVDVITDILGLIIGLMIGAVRLVKGVITIVGRFLIALTSDPTEQVLTTSKSPPPPQPQTLQSVNSVVPPSVRRNQTAMLFNAMRTGGGKMEVTLNEEEAIPPDLGAANEEEQKPTDLASILQEKECWLLSEEEQLLLERVDSSKVETFTGTTSTKSAALTSSRSNAGKQKNTAPVSKKTQNMRPSPQIQRESVEEPTVVEQKPIPTSTFLISIFARNFYRFKLGALILAFMINLLLLFYRIEKRGAGAEGEVEEAVIGTSFVTSITDTVSSIADSLQDNEIDVVPEEEEEWITLSESASYLGPLLRILAIAHSLLSMGMLVAYYFLKVPLVIFKREKEISRMLEFEGIWITEQPSDERLRAQWDKLVLSTPSFPHMYWDKFVKKKVLKKYREQYDQQQIRRLLGMKSGSNNGGSSGITSGGHPEEASNSWFYLTWLREMDLQYLLWKWGVIFTDNSFLYLVVYFIVSLLGNANYFFFSCHLLDVAISFKTLATIVQSVTHNGKQLVLTVMLTSIVIYLYTVIAFNFFRKFYTKEEDGEKEYKCNDMLTCFVFHLHTGLRAGGGIGDEIEPPDGDAHEALRILFDMSFFFFVIIILLAIIQGFIIDAFGDLRDQLEQVREDLESKCFICGIGKEYFDATPHGFDRHVEREHNFANYMYFLMHIINKPDTEFTGQETYVWELYQQRCLDFFPIGNCFRKQYEEELQVK
ncbi:Ryanodine receptor 2 [Taenia crassiceps]|uniref:Ryanodine receptor 2 n=1 Tax=Taenia crassiceps TaxID=6207 RepID=A0ABR4Q6E9_9CEST